MLERTLVYVDTSYLLASFYNSWEIGARGQLEIDLREVVHVLDRMITQQAYQISFNEICHGLGYLFLGLILVLWLAKAPFHKAAKAETAGAH